MLVKILDDADQIIGAVGEFIELDSDGLDMSKDARAEDMVLKLDFIVEMADRISARAKLTKSEL